MEIRLKDLTTKITKGTTPSNIGEDFSEQGIMYFRSELIGKSKYIDKSEGLLYIDEKVHNKLKRSQIEKGDMLFSMAGIYLGKISLVGDDDYPANTNQAVAIIRFIRDICNVDYLYYYMSQKWFNNYINIRTAQAAQPNINLEQIGKLKVLLPERAIQNKIAGILSAYDNLIENNNKRIALLEKSAQELYKEWFVRFRFPGHEYTKFVNGLPEGWEYGRLKDIMSFGAGKTRPDSDGSFPVYGGNGILGYCDLYNNENVIIIGRVGAYCGSVYYEPNKCWISDNALYAIDKLDALIYDYYLLKSLQLNSRHIGTGQPLITQGLLNKIKIVIPNKDLIKKYNNLAQDLFIKQNLLKKQNQNLTKQRDLLLPRLMSGKLEV